jgi:hypothetical protein
MLVESPPSSNSPSQAPISASFSNARRTRFAALRLGRPDSNALAKSNFR